jgi:hypothetical protein
MLQPLLPMDVTSAETATLGIWTIARFAALAVLATEASFLYMRMKEGGHEGGHDARLRRGDHVPDSWRGDHVPDSPRGVSRVFWALTPAVLLLGLCFWCTVFVSTERGARARPVVAQLGR